MKPCLLVTFHQMRRCYEFRWEDCGLLRCDVVSYTSTYRYQNANRHIPEEHNTNYTVCGITGNKSLCRRRRNWSVVTRCWIAAARRQSNHVWLLFCDRFLKRPLLTVSRCFMNVAKRVLWRMVIILKANKVNLFVSSVLFVFWYHSPNILDTPHIWSSL
jgi:hypothetical protein